jgi:hypothetical protein
MILPISARDPYKSGHNLSSRVFSAFFRSPDFSSRPPHFSLACAERVARSRSFPAGDATDLTGQFNFSIGSGQFFHAVSPQGRPVSESATVAGAPVATDGELDAPTI